MTAWARVVTVAESQGRDLLRRRLALGMLLALPAVIYLTVVGEEPHLSPDSDPFTLRVGVIGVAWTIAGGAFFLGLSSRAVDERLVIGRYRRGELAAGRLLFLTALAVPVVVIYSALITTLSRGDTLPIVLAVAATGVIALGVGLALVALLPRELEGVLALIAVVGIQTSLPPDAVFAPALPFHGPIELISIAWTSNGSLLPPLLHAAAATAVLLLLFFALWGRRLVTR